MLLKSIRVNSFRNLKGEVDWGNGINILHGNNAQGKTNWLEAIFLLAYAKSFRTTRLHETITFGKTAASVQGHIARGNRIERDLEVIVHSNTKQTLVNGKREPVARRRFQLSRKTPSVAIISCAGRRSAPRSVRRMSTIRCDARRSLSRAA